MRDRFAATTRTTALTLAAALAVAVLPAGCARVGQPGGGPADTTPPEISSTEPAEGATGVEADATVRLEFSEEMNRVAVERAFSMSPEIELKNFSWDGRTLVARPEEAFPESTTLVVKVAETCSDDHGVKMEGPFVLMFSTGPTIDTGVITGEVTRSGEPVAGAIVWACRSAVRTDAGAVFPCRHAAVTADDGTFSIEGVAVSERPYVLLSFIDSDEDGVYSVNEEEGIIADSEALIDEPGAFASGIKMELEIPATGEESPDAGEEELWNSPR